jgi:hypothetical protein
MENPKKIHSSTGAARSERRGHAARQLLSELVSTGAMESTQACALEHKLYMLLMVT